MLPPDPITQPFVTWVYKWQDTDFYNLFVVHSHNCEQLRFEWDDLT
jgi:hypothetical protein